MRPQGYTVSTTKKVTRRKDEGRRSAWLQAIAFFLVAVLLIVFTPAMAGVYRVQGGSDAPTILDDDFILVNRLAYGLWLPWRETPSQTWADPKRGDFVAFRFPGDDKEISKRVVAVPGDVVELRKNRLYINGRPLTYETLIEGAFSWVPETNNLGKVVVLEIGDGYSHEISFTPGASKLTDFGPVTVEPRRYFVLGDNRDNRDNSLDSRSYGTISRDWVRGKVLTAFTRS